MSVVDCTLVTLDITVVADEFVDRVMLVKTVISDRGGLVLSVHEDGRGEFDFDVTSVLSHESFAFISGGINVSKLKFTASKVFSSGNGLVISGKIFA